VLTDQDESEVKRGRGRPRKWPSETARREHEAARRRLRNKVDVTFDDLNDVRRLTALADDLQRRVSNLTGELAALRHENAWLKRENEQLKSRAPAATTGSRPMAAAPTQLEPPTDESKHDRALGDAPAAPGRPALNRSQRRAAEREARREQRHPQV